MPISMDGLADDLAAESAVLRDLLAGLDEPGWRRPTPAAGWDISDQVSHLAHFDEVAVRSASTRTGSPPSWPASSPRAG